MFDMFGYMSVASSCIPAADREILRKLAARVAEIGNLPVQKETAELWRRLNQLERVRPLVWMNEIPWHEINVNDELTLRTHDKFCRDVEWKLRTTIYQWEHMRCDMVVEPVFLSRAFIHDSGTGLETPKMDTIVQDERGGIRSHHFHPQGQSEKDLEQIKMPEISVDHEVTEQNYLILKDIFGDILPVRKQGIDYLWFNPWDKLVQWWGIEPALTDLVMRPELMHAAIDRLMNAMLYRLDRYEQLNLLSLNNGNFRVGSGGFGYTAELPQKDVRLDHIRPIDQWGSATAQIFSDVSPAMHDEFALRYEKKWLNRFGLTYYGCCEPLHLKLDILKTVPNLRKISMSPWAKVEKYVEQLDRRYVLSHKPNPAILAPDDWNPTRARADLVKILDQAKGCAVEVILKDISTVRNEPQRLWEWARIAMEVVQNYS